MTKAGKHLLSSSIALLSEWPLLQFSDKAKFALKVGLSLTLAYMVPMAMGWSQPSTAATTVMLIAATGGVRDSLMKGTLRIAGTVVGASIGLTLIALFAQDRLLYLLCASILLSLTLYLYKAYQGDGTLFMLAAVVMLMVFNGGDAEGAFLYGLDRAFMTAFGVAVYTLIGSFLWPVRAEQGLAKQTLTTLKLDFALFQQMQPACNSRDSASDNNNTTDLIEQLSAAQNAQHEQWLRARGEDEEVKTWNQEWQYLLHYQAQLSQELAAVQEPAKRKPIDYALHIPHYHLLVTRVESQFAALIALWDSDRTATSAEQNSDQTDPFANVESLNWPQLTHLQQAQLSARVASLRAIHQLLQQLIKASNCLHTHTVNDSAPSDLVHESAFVAVDVDNVKTALQVLVAFWFSSLIWVLLNPPGGYLFVVLSSALIVLVSYTPVPPKLLYILFTFGFLCALPCYIFLLPQLSRSYELALFIFAYTAFAHYLFPSPVNIFFMFGLFTMGIDNNMAYHLDVVLSIMLMFYLVISVLLVITRFIFPGKPEHLFCLMRKRLFRHLSKLLALRGADDSQLWVRVQRHFYLQSITRTLTKMRLWSSQIDTSYFNSTSKQALTDYVDACVVACFRANTVMTAAKLDADNPLVIVGRQTFNDAMIVTAAGSLSAGSGHTITQQRDQISYIEQSLDRLLEQHLPSANAARDRSRFYVNLNLLALLWDSLHDCELASHKIDWVALKQSRF